MKSFHSLKGGMAQVFGEITLEEQTDICDPISESGKEKIQLVSDIQKHYYIIKYHCQVSFLILKQYIDATAEDRSQDFLTIEVLTNSNYSDAISAQNYKENCKTTKQMPKCKLDHEICNTLSFRLGSTLRQISLFTSKLQYKIGETGKISILSPAINCISEYQNIGHLFTIDNFYLFF